MSAHSLNAVDLGFPLGHRNWGMVIAVGEGKVLPIAFSEWQALEIAKRILDHYGVSETRTVYVSPD